MDFKKLLNELHTSGYFDAEILLRNLLNGKEELAFLERFVKENAFDGEAMCDQLRSLWTAYCIHFGLEPEEARYGHDLARLWFIMNERDNAFWSNLESFDSFMGCYLM